MAQIILTIPDEKLTEVLDAIIYLYPIPVDEEDNPLYTAQQWGKEWLRRVVVKTVAQAEQKQKRDAIGYVEEDDLVS